MAQFPTTKTVPQDKDIAVSEPKSNILGTGAREQLSVVLDTIDQKLKQEQIDRIADVDAEEARALAAEADLQQQIDDEVARATAAEAAEQAARIAADNAEQAARIAADTSLQNQIDAERDILRMTASGKSVAIADVSSTRLEDGTKLSIANGSLIADFAGATVNFSTGTVNGNPDFTPIDFAGNAGKWAKYALVLLPGIPNTILVLKGESFGASASAAEAPAFDGGIPIGIVSVQDDGSGGIGTIEDVLQTELIQFSASGSGNGSGSGEAGPLSVEENSNYEFYTPSDFKVQKDAFIDTTTGTNQILGLKKVILDAGQIVTSIDLTGPSFHQDDSLLNYARAKLLYNVGLVDQNPTVEFSRDGGLSWIPAVVSYPSAGGNLVVAEVALPVDSTAVFTGGAFSIGGPEISADKIAILFSPQFRTKASNLKVFIGTSATTGSITAKLHNAGGGVPTTLIAAANESFAAGLDITSTVAEKSFSLPLPKTLEVGSIYAIVIEGTGLNGTIKSIVCSSPSTENQSSATYSAGWTPSANQFPFEIMGSGADLRMRLTSGTNDSELIGFGVDYVLELPEVNDSGLAFIDPKYDAVVGTVAQFATGMATHTTLQSAINDVSAGSKILMLKGTIAGAVSVNKEVSIEGQGRGSVINGAVTMSANFCELRSVRFMSSLTITGQGNFVQGWQASGQTLTGDEDLNHIRVFEE